MGKRRERRARQRSGRRHGHHTVTGSVGLEELLRQVSGFATNGSDWESFADDVLPVFERARPFPFDVGPPALAIVPPGVTVGFAVDAGPAFMRVSLDLARRWPVDMTQLADRALDNLGRRARTIGRHDLVRDRIDGVPTVAFQSREGWASTAVLRPDVLEAFFGREPRTFIAPGRDLLIGLPVDVDPAFATWLAEEFEADDPNALHLEGFEWRDGVVRCRALRGDAPHA
jgi:hypothetical protein